MRPFALLRFVTSRKYISLFLLLIAFGMPAAPPLGTAPGRQADGVDGPAELRTTANASANSSSTRTSGSKRVR